MTNRVLANAAYWALAGLSLVLAGQASAAEYISSPDMTANPVEKQSEHVYAIRSFPNVFIVVGTRATLVVDTGLGPANGAVIVSAAKRLAKGTELYLTTTHYHPEHAAGEDAFPAETKLVRCDVQQQDVDELAQPSVERFRQNPNYKDYLPEVHFRKPAISFTREQTLDLGGISAKLMCYGPAHTRGDLEVFVPQDSVLISGDVVQNKIYPAFTAMEASTKSWIAALDELAKLNPRIVLPDHGDFGDGSLIGLQRGFLADLQTRALALKAEGKTPEQAAGVLNDEFKAKYTGWRMRELTPAIRAAYASAP